MLQGDAIADRVLMGVLHLDRNPAARSRGGDAHEHQDALVIDVEEPFASVRRTPAWPPVDVSIGEPARIRHAIAGSQ